MAVLLLVSLPIQSPSPPPSPPNPMEETCAQTQSSTAPPTLLSPVKNETTLSNGTVVDETYYPVLLLRPDTTGAICVRYTDPLSKVSQNLVGATSLSTGIFEVNKSSGGGGETMGVVPLPRGGILSISASPSLIQVQPGRSEVIAYTLTSGNSTGVYEAMMPPWGYCWGLPIFVGGSPSQLNATDYSQLAFITNLACFPPGASNLVVLSIAFSNIALEYVSQPGSND